MYCGYSLSNTVYRVILAGLTIIFGFAMLPGFTDKAPKLSYYLTYYFTMFWICACAADCTAVYMSYGVCNSFFGATNASRYNIEGFYQCENHRYGEKMSIFLL